MNTVRDATTQQWLVDILQCAIVTMKAAVKVMDRDARKMRGERPFVFTNLKSGHGLDTVRSFIETAGMLRPQ